MDTHETFCEAIERVHRMDGMYSSDDLKRILVECAKEDPEAFVAAWDRVMKPKLHTNAVPLVEESK